MLRLEVEDETLDLNPGTSITVRRQSPAYLGEDVGKVKGDYSYPFDIPLTDHNRANLRHPNRLDSSELPRQNLRARLYVGPQLILSGRLAIQKPGRTSAKVFLYSNPLADLTKLKLNDTEQGTLETNGPSSLSALMKATAEAPLDHDYVFAPVYNYALRDDDEFIPPVSDFVNSWNFDGQFFMTTFHVSPFLRVGPMLKRAVEAGGYSFTDGLHVSEEMQRQILISSRSLRFEQELSYRIPLKMCLPSMSVSDFLKSLCLTYCAAPFSELNGTHINLIPLRTLINAAPEDDWTNYADIEYTRDPGNGAVARYQWGGDAYEPGYYFAEWDPDHPEPTRETADFVDENNDIIPIRGGETVYFHGRSAVSIRKKIRGLLGVEFQGSFGYVENDRGNDVISPAMTPAQTHIVYSFPSDGDQLVLATVSLGMVGIQTGEVEVPVAFGDITSERGQVDARLSFYRGLQRTRNGQLFPMINHEPSNSYFRQLEGDEVGLNWLGPNGLYQRWWKDWDGMLSNSSGVTRDFLLPLPSLLRFDFRHKIRVENQNYFVKSMEFSVSDAGVGVTKCALVSVS